jgi:hypothetical protein
MEWEDIAKKADEKKGRGESTGSPPQPTLLAKRRYDGTPGSIPRAGSAMDGLDDLPTLGQSIVLPQNSSPRPPSLQSLRFPPPLQAVYGIGPHPSPVKTTKKLSLSDYKAARMKKTDTSNKPSSGSSPTVAPAVLKPSQANAQIAAEAAHASSGLSATKYRCLVTGCKSKDKSWPHLDSFRRHLIGGHAGGPFSLDQLNDLIRR